MFIHVEFRSTGSHAAPSPLAARSARVEENAFYFGSGGGVSRVDRIERIGPSPVGLGGIGEPPG